VSSILLFFVLFIDISCIGTSIEILKFPFSIHNGDLNHESVQNRINFFLTRKWCWVRFNLTDELLEHEKVHEMLDELVDKPPVVPLSQDNSGYGTLSHTQNAWCMWRRLVHWFTYIF
jgi:hypothetical protein